MNRFLRPLLAISLLAAPALAQPAAELLQRGIYFQDAAGNLDAAIQIYRQILSSAPTDRGIASQAQYRLTGALLRKGDLAAAAQEFSNLARQYTDYPKLVNSMAERVRSIAKYGPADILLGSLQNGRYHHYWTGVEFPLPAGWTTKAQATADGGDRIDFSESPAGPIIGFLWAMVDPSPADQIQARLQGRLQAKVNNQRRDPDPSQTDTTRFQGHGFKLRSETIQPATIAGQPGLTAVGEYFNARGEKMLEWLVFVNSERTRFFMSVKGKEPEFPALQQQAAQALSSAIIP